MAILDAKPAVSVTQSRLLFIDNIRWILIVDVIAHHAAVTYSHVGSWYFLDPVRPSRLTGLALATFESFNQAFFMGFLFLVAGYFVPRAFDSKGAARFLRDRAVRLGIPTLLYMVIIHPFIVYWMLRNFDNPRIPPLSTAYLPFFLSGRVLSASGPMWFALALLVFCAVYALVRQLTGPRSLERTRELPPPSHRQVLLLLLLMGLCSFAVRLFAPIGYSVFNMQPCYFSQYIILFVGGVLAYRNQWLSRLPRPFGLIWFRLACTLGVLLWIVFIFTSGAAQGNTQPLLGGWHWQSAAFSFWEAFFCLGMCLGLVVLFRDRYNWQNGFARWMSKNSFTAYLLHPPILIAITLALRSWSAPIGVRFLVAALLAIPATFLISGALRPRLPGLRNIL